MPKPRTVVITGASRGIGLALVREYAARGDRVVAVVRDSSDVEGLLDLAESAAVSVHRSDITSEDALAGLVDEVSSDTEAVDVLVNNAGIMVDGESLETIRSEDLIENYVVNAVSPAIVTKVFLPLLRKAERATVVNISSSFASLELKNPNMPARYSYSMSKAAVNMLSKTMAFELADDGITVVAMHPGWTRTGIGGPDAQMAPEESASAIVATLDDVGPERSGEFMAWTGSNLPW